ncbi:LIPS lipase, partial [Cardinalis cardinalis]|nr:LIPS lipase [Cardinalis cardinalis]
MDLLQSLQLLAKDNLDFFSPPASAISANSAISGAATSRRLADASSALLRHGRHLGPALSRLAEIAPGFDLDPSTPGNGY